jgi:hypothetical protein
MRKRWMTLGSHACSIVYSEADRKTQTVYKVSTDDPRPATPSGAERR